MFHNSLAFSGDGERNTERESARELSVGVTTEGVTEQEAQQMIGMSAGQQAK